MTQGLSPAVILYAANGIPLAVVDGIGIPVGTRATLIAGTDQAGVAHFARMSAGGALDVSLGIVVSALNTTSTPLGGGASYTGGTEDVSQFTEIDINLAGGPGAAPGQFFFEFSPDGTNWDVSVLVGGISLPGPNCVPQYLRVMHRFFRVRYVNGATPQSSFRLTTILHKGPSLRLTRYLNQQIDATEGVENVRAFVAGKRDDGTYGNISVTAQDALKVSLDAETYAAKTIDVAASGDNTVHTPGGGLRTRLWYVALSASDLNTGPVDVSLRFGVASPLYKFSLAPGAIIARNIGAGRRYLQGAVDAAFIANLSTAQTVSVSLEYEEV